ncbi:MAG: hypothetical protein BWZ04_00400 [Firmicutes bacterium ADurb.BinA205]|nr:MAG: hypothetical protein BWZ04_00400 [Firmicutes bacterium ADurb.BinA205]
MEYNERTYELAERFCEKINEYISTPFHIYPQDDNNAALIRSWVDQAETDEDTALLYLKYHDTSSGGSDVENYAAEVRFTETLPDEYTVSVRVLWHGEAAKADLSFSHGDVSYISDFESEEDKASRCCMPNDVYCSNNLADEQNDAINSLMETIRICLEKIIADEEY